MGNVKEINTKSRTYYFFDDMIYIKDFDSNLLNIEKKLYKSIDIYYIGYITMKYSDYVKINSANPLYLITGETDGYIEEKNGNEYLTLVSADKNEEVLIKYTELWDKIKNLIKTMIVEAGECGKHYIKIRFQSSDNLPLNKTLKLHNLIIVFRSVFQDDGKYYPQIILDECLYELSMLEHDRIDVSEGIDINKTNSSEECDICHYWYFKDIGFKY